ncbi:hypothetical protein BH18THE2_BH18THE2_43510 [soil metagenome]
MLYLDPRTLEEITEKIMKTQWDFSSDAKDNVIKLLKILGQTKSEEQLKVSHKMSICQRMKE